MLLKIQKRIVALVVDSSLFSEMYVIENTEKNCSFSVDSSLFSGTYVIENIIQ